MENQWQEDVLGPEYQACEIQQPDDYEGAVKCVVVRRQAEKLPSEKAVLYVHGFIDYFFQKELAEQINSWGLEFYAVDLRKYGRALMPHQKPNYCRSIEEYFEDIDAALNLMRENGIKSIVLMGHSTGGLTTPLFLNQYKGDDIKALLLNSPFFDFNVPGPLRMTLPAVMWLGKRFPNMKMDILPQHYPQSLHKDYKGEWDFDIRWKPIQNFPQYFAWIRAIRLAQVQLQSGLNITQPVLVMHSDKSYKKLSWSEEVRKSDAVLDVEHIAKYANRLGENVEQLTINDGLHDLVLSRKDVRDQVYREMENWLNKQGIID